MMTTEINFIKVIRPGHGPDGHVFCSIEYRNGNLSISGVEGPTRNGNARGGVGQITDFEIEMYAAGWDAEKVKAFKEVWERWHLNDMRAGCEHQRGPDWDASKELTIYSYRLDNEIVKERRSTEDRATASIKAGTTFTPTPRETLLANLPHTFFFNDTATTEIYTPNRPQYEGDHYNRPSKVLRAGHTPVTEHPEGLLSKPCPECGYKYGTAWKRVDVPADVVDFLRSLPDTDITPAWV